MDYMAVLKEMGLTGDTLSEDEFDRAVELAKRKVKLSGRDENYISLLLPDVIKEWLFNRTLFNLATMVAE